MPDELFESKFANHMLRQIEESHRMILEYLAWRFGVDAGGGGVRGPVSPHHPQLVALGKILVANAQSLEKLLGE
jgi:hypothetical protein